jgi:hypothetical protein
MKKNLFVFLLSVLVLPALAQSNNKYECTITAGTFVYLFETLYIHSEDPLFQKGLPNRPSVGASLAVVNGIQMSRNFHLGVGAGLGRVKNINGVTLFADMRLDFSQKPRSLFAYLNPGYSHFWNPYYDGGIGSVMTDIGLGFQCKEVLGGRLLISAGLLFSHANGYLSSKVGFAF